MVRMYMYVEHSVSFNSLKMEATEVILTQKLTPQSAYRYLKLPTLGTS